VREGPKTSTVTNLSLNWHRTGQDQRTTKNLKCCYLMAGKGIYLNFVSDSEVAYWRQQTAAFSRSATSPQAVRPKQVGRMA
jgi:hypothetical protein